MSIVSERIEAGAPAPTHDAIEKQRQQQLEGIREVRRLLQTAQDLALKVGANRSVERTGWRE